MGTLITIVLTVGLAVYAVWAVWYTRRHPSACSGGCSGCAMAGSCHKAQAHASKKG